VSAVHPTTQQLEAGRGRRERGNPPGKRADPLGDQLSWEQFLDAVRGEKTVWIITRDTDYTEVVNKQKLLNPFLQRELADRGVQSIEVFDNLATAIRSLRLAGLSGAKFLGDEKLTQLEKEEADAHYPRPPYLVWPDGAWKCPNCHRTNVTTDLVAHPSGYGGWSYWATCAHCGYKIDTGEAYDD
jgi:hypothetical protein